MCISVVLGSESADSTNKKSSKEVNKGKRDAISYGGSDSGSSSGYTHGGLSSDHGSSGYSLSGLSYKSPLQLSSLSLGSTKQEDGSGSYGGAQGYSLGGLSALSLGGKGGLGQIGYYSGGQSQGYQTEEHGNSVGNGHEGSGYTLGSVGHGLGGSSIGGGQNTHGDQNTHAQLASYGGSPPAAYLDLSSLNEALKSHGVAPLVSSDPSAHIQSGGYQGLQFSQGGHAQNPIQISSGSHSNGGYGSLLSSNHGDASSGSYGGLQSGGYGGASAGSYGGLSAGSYGGLLSGGHANLLSGSTAGLHSQSAALQLVPVGGHAATNYGGLSLSNAGGHSGSALGGLTFGGSSGHNLGGSSLSNHGQGYTLVPASLKAGPVTFGHQQLSSGMSGGGYHFPSFSFGGPVSAALTAHQPSSSSSSYSSGGDNSTPVYATGIKGLGHYTSAGNSFGALSSKFTSSPYTSGRFSSFPNFSASSSQLGNRHTSTPSFGSYSSSSSGSSKFRPSAYVGSSQEGNDHSGYYSSSSPQKSNGGYESRNYNTIDYSKSQ